MNMEYYICTGGCEGISDKKDIVCQAGGCVNKGKYLVECDCKDRKHLETLINKNKKE